MYLFLLTPYCNVTDATAPILLQTCLSPVGHSFHRRESFCGLLVTKLLFTSEGEPPPALALFGTLPLCVLIQRSTSAAEINVVWICLLDQQHLPFRASLHMSKHLDSKYHALRLVQISPEQTAAVFIPARLICQGAPVFAELMAAKPYVSILHRCFCILQVLHCQGQDIPLQCMFP